jgi:hypothetical protein
MLKPAEYEDTLRAVGRKLDEAGLKGIYVQETKKQLRVSARQAPTGAPTELRFRAEDLRKLLEEAHSRRGGGGLASPQALSYENMLRALGHELDQRECEAFFIGEYEGDEIRVSCRGPSDFRMRYVSIHHRLDLQRLLEEAVERRGPGS